MHLEDGFDPLQGVTLSFAAQRLAIPTGRIGSLERVVSTRGGLVSSVIPLATGTERAEYRVCQALLGDVGSTADVTLAEGLGHGSLDGAGTGSDLAAAADLAVVEAVERWSSTVVTVDQLTVSAAQDQESGLDMTTVPTCSPAEFAHPSCPLVPFDPTVPLRWVTGLDLTTGSPVSVPAVMTYLGMRQWSSSERWWLPISTGCAAHTDLSLALLAGLFEVVERDALTLTWLHQLPLPELELDLPSLSVARDRANASGAGRTRLFDATLDTGVPTVYAVNESSGPVATVVGCATAADASTAVRKVLREVQSCRIAIEAAGPGGDDPDTFLSAIDGARWMGDPRRAGAFSFLDRSPRRLVSEMPPLSAASADALLPTALQAVRDVGGRPVAVDLTTREARRAGLHVVRVIVPELQPMTFSPRARYLAHPRVARGAFAAGYQPKPAHQLNALPQPMA